MLQCSKAQVKILPSPNEYVIFKNIKEATKNPFLMIGRKGGGSKGLNGPALRK